MHFKDEAIKNIIKIEGGYVDDPSDSGGETKYGITKKVAMDFGIKKPMKDLTKKDATEIYEELYWHSIKADDILSMSESIAEKLFDIGVNMGVGRAAEFMQRSLNVLNNQEEYYNDIAVDKSIGNVTLSRLRSFLKKRGEADGELVFVNMLNCLQGSFYVELAERREKDEKFIFGWMRNRVGIK